MKRKYFLRRMRNFMAVVLIPIALLIIVTVSMTMSTQKRRMSQTNDRGIEAVQTNISMVLDSVLTQNRYITGMTRASMVMKKAFRRESLSYADSVYLRSLISSLTSMVNSYDYLDSVLIYIDGYDRALTSGGIADLSEQDYESWYQVYYSMTAEEKTKVAAVVCNKGEISEQQQLAVCSRLLNSSGCVVVLLNVEHLQEMMKILRLSGSEELYLVAADGSLWAATQELDREERTDFAAELQNLMGASEKGEDVWGKVGNDHRLFSWRRLTNPTFYILSSVDRSMLYEDLWNRLMPLFIMAGVVMVVIILTAYWSTRRSFDEIELVLQMFEDAEAGKIIQRPAGKPRDEYDVIMNNIMRMFLNNNYLNIQLQEKQYRQQNAELAALQLQINPHFLYNTLQTLDMESRKLGDDGKISKIIGYVSAILKYSLSDPQKAVTLQEEVNYLKQYIEIQRYRFGENFIIYYDVEESLMNAEVFRLMLQPVVENSLIHALRGKEGMGYMTVQAHLVRGKIRFHVLDNGEGMSLKELEQLRSRIADHSTKSIGLTNLDRRLRLRYPEENGLRIDSYEGIGTIVSFDIPLQRLNNTKG